MPDYQKLYHMLFNAITDALEAMSRGEPLQARLLLIRAQQDTEEIYISAGDDRAAGEGDHVNQGTVANAFKSLSGNGSLGEGAVSEAD